MIHFRRITFFFLLVVSVAATFNLEACLKTVQSLAAGLKYVDVMIIGELTDAELAAATTFGTILLPALDPSMLLPSDQQLIILTTRDDLAPNVAEILTFQSIHNKVFPIIIAHGEVLSVTTLESLPLTIMSELYLITNGKVQEVYKMQPSLSTIHVGDIGDFNDKSGIQRRHSLSKWDRRNNLMGLHLRVGYGTDQRFGRVINGTLSGYYGDIITYIARNLNFTFDATLSIDRKYGSLLDNGSFNGLVGMLQRDEIDIACAQLSITQIRTQECDFAGSIWEEPQWFFMKRPPGGVEYSIYTSAFSWWTWLSMILIAVILIGALNLNLWIRNKHRPERWKARYAGHFLVSCLVNKELDQDFVNREDHTSARILFWTSLTFGWLLYAGYNALLTSSLTVNLNNLPVSNFHDLLNSRHGFATNYGAANTDLFVKSKPGSVFYDVYKKKMEGNPISKLRNKQDAVDVMLKLDYVILKGGKYMRSLPEYPCQFIDVPTPVLLKPTSLAFRKNSTFLPLFNFHLAKLREGGVLADLENTYVSPRHEQNREKQCITDENSTSSGFRMTVILFAVMAFGVVTSLVLALIERLLGCTNSVKHAHIKI